jgi:hypothetical protein
LSVFPFNSAGPSAPHRVLLSARLPGRRLALPVLQVSAEVSSSKQTLDESPRRPMRVLQLLWMWKKQAPAPAGHADLPALLFGLPEAPSDFGQSSTLSHIIGAAKHGTTYAFATIIFNSTEFSPVETYSCSFIFPATFPRRGICLSSKFDCVRMAAQHYALYCLFSPLCWRPTAVAEDDGRISTGRFFCGIDALSHVTIVSTGRSSVSTRSTCIQPSQPHLTQSVRHWDPTPRPDAAVPT